MKNILEVKNLNMEYRTLEGNVKAIQDVSFNIPLNSSFGLWGNQDVEKPQLLCLCYNYKQIMRKLSQEI